MNVLNDYEYAGECIHKTDKMKKVGKFGGMRTCFS